MLSLFLQRAKGFIYIPRALLTRSLLETDKKVTGIYHTS